MTKSYGVTSEKLDNVFFNHMGVLSFYCLSPLLQITAILAMPAGDPPDTPSQITFEGVEQQTVFAGHGTVLLSRCLIWLLRSGLSLWRMELGFGAFDWCTLRSLRPHNVPRRPKSLKVSMLKTFA